MKLVIKNNLALSEDCGVPDTCNADCDNCNLFIGAGNLIRLKIISERGNYEGTITLKEDGEGYITVKVEGVDLQ